MEAVTIYEDANFGGIGIFLDVGNYRLSGAGDLNDAVSSIQVPAGLVALVYEHADSGGGIAVHASGPHAQQAQGLYTLILRGPDDPRPRWRRFSSGSVDQPRPRCAVHSSPARPAASATRATSSGRSGTGNET
jgi:hypothetical protein